MAEPSAAAERPPAATAAGWTDVRGLVHGFFGRDGGHSDGPWRGLNLSQKVGDDADTVGANWRALAQVLGGLRPVRMEQVHGAHVRRIGTDATASAGECDGLLTGEPGLALAVMTADCVPILMVAPERRAVMALHAGWRGTVAGIAAAGIETAKRELGIEPGEWRAALGPSIGGCCYEVSREIGDQLESRWGAMADAWQPAGERGQLDLRAANRRILANSGVDEAAIDAVGPCTACAHRQYFSHRQSGGRTGRQVSAIGFRP